MIWDTPFGHSGEEALNACMQPHGGFDHNAQSLRIVTLLEQRYAAFDGLNLTWETLEGLVKHNGPLLDAQTDLTDLPFAIQNLQLKWFRTAHYAILKLLIAALADDIAYNNHDIDDGLRAGLFRFDDVMELPLIGAV